MKTTDGPVDLKSPMVDFSSSARFPAGVTCRDSGAGCSVGARKYFQTTIVMATAMKAVTSIGKTPDRARGSKGGRVRMIVSGGRGPNGSKSLVMALVWYARRPPVVDRTFRPASGGLFQRRLGDILELHLARLH